MVSSFLDAALLTIFGCGNNIVFLSFWFFAYMLFFHINGFTLLKLHNVESYCVVDYFDFDFILCEYKYLILMISYQAIATARMIGEFPERIGQPECQVRTSFSMHA